MGNPKNEPSYEVLKGLQRPIEFKGIRGRFLLWAAGTIAAAFFGFVIIKILLGEGLAFLVAIVSLVGGYIIILLKQKEGLYKKQRNKNVVVYKNLFRQI